jgi:hypothetical protein
LSKTIVKQSTTQKVVVVLHGPVDQARLEREEQELKHRVEMLDAYVAPPERFFIDAQGNATEMVKR